MTIGGTIGVGLFLGSAKAIHIAGPLLLCSYLVTGIAVLFMLRALGEVAVAYPEAGSIGAFAHRFFGPLAGYLTGWTYWACWIVVCMAQATAIGIYAQHWWPALPQWLPALFTVALVTLIDLAAVRVYGELEFWLSLIKVVAIVAMIVLGGAMIVFGFGNHGHAVGLANLWSQPGGFFAKGWMGFAQALVIATFAFNGIEMIGVTAGEAKDPVKTLPKAIDGVFWRMLVFYVGTLFVIMTIYPYTSLDTHTSPFVLVSDRLGIPHAGDLMNFVVITAAASSFNGGMFVTTRMLHSLSSEGVAPARLSRLDRRGVPVAAQLVCCALQLLGVGFNYLLPGRVFEYYVGVSTTCLIVVWMLIMVVQHRHRRRLTPDALRAPRYALPFHPWSNLLVLIFLGAVVVVMATDAINRAALLLLMVWLGFLAAAYPLIRARRPRTG